MEHEKSNLFLAPLDDTEEKLIRFMNAWTRQISNMPINISDEEKDVRNKCIASILAAIWKAASAFAGGRRSTEDAFKCVVICLLAKEDIKCLDRKYFNKKFCDAADSGFRVLDAWAACREKTGHHVLNVNINGFDVNAEEIIEDVGQITLTEMNLLATYLRALERAGLEDERVESFVKTDIGDDAYCVANGLRRLTMSYEGADVLGCFPLSDDEAGLHILTAEQFDEFITSPHDNHKLHPDSKRPKEWAKH